MEGDMERTYPLSGNRYTYKTMTCRLDENDVAANREAIDALFLQFAAALRAFRRLMPVRAPYRDAFRKEDMASVKVIAPGLIPGLRNAALDKTIEMWRSFETAPGKGMPLSRAERSDQLEGPVTVRLPRKEYCLILEGPDTYDKKKKR